MTLHTFAPSRLRFILSGLPRRLTAPRNDGVVKMVQLLSVLRVLVVEKILSFWIASPRFHGGRNDGGVLLYFINKFKRE